MTRPSTSPSTNPTVTAPPGIYRVKGPPALRWALYEAAQASRRGGERSPDRAFYLEVKERIGGNRACLALARKMLKRCYHTLRELGDDALAPPAAPTQSGRGSAATRRGSSGSPRQTNAFDRPKAARALAA
jgi:hypothetical protein